MQRWERLPENVRKPLRNALREKAEVVFADISYVLAAVRCAYLLEHVFVKAVLLEPFAATLHKLSPDIVLILLDEGFLFVAHRRLLLAALERNLHDPQRVSREDRTDRFCPEVALVAVDAKLAGPQLLSATAREQLFYPLLRRLLDSLKELPECVCFLRLQVETKLLPMAAGFLCEYPVILCFADLGCPDTDNCLSMHPMNFHTWQLQALSTNAAPLTSPLLKYSIPQLAPSPPPSCALLHGDIAAAVRCLELRLDERLRPLGYRAQLQETVLALPKLLL
jgi:hypothetical protein